MSHAVFYIYTVGPNLRPPNSDITTQTALLEVADAVVLPVSSIPHTCCFVAGKMQWKLSEPMQNLNYNFTVINIVYHSRKIRKRNPADFTLSPKNLKLQLIWLAWHHSNSDNNFIKKIKKINKWFKSYPVKYCIIDIGQQICMFFKINFFPLIPLLANALRCNSDNIQEQNYF